MNKNIIGIFIIFISYLSVYAQQPQLVPYRIGEKWGYSDTAGKIIFEPQYQSADFFVNDVAFVKQDSFYYLINSKNEIIAGKYLSHGNFVNNICPVQLPNSMYIYINPDGQMAFKRIYKIAESFSEERAVVRMGMKLGVINTNGDWIKEPSFESSSVYYKDGFLMVVENGRYYYMDKNGKELKLPEEAIPSGLFSEGLAAVYFPKKVFEKGKIEKQNSLKFIDTTGKIVLDSFINDGENYSDYINYVSDFKDGKAIVKVGNKMGFDYYFIDKRKRFSPLFTSAICVGDSLFIGVSGYYHPKIKILNKNFFPLGIFTENPKEMGIFGNGLIGVRNSNGAWGFANNNAKIIIPYIYNKVGAFYNGYAWVSKKDKEGYINTYGKEFFREK